MINFYHTVYECAFKSKRKSNMKWSKEAGKRHYGALCLRENIFVPLSKFFLMHIKIKWKKNNNIYIYIDKIRKIHIGQIEYSIE